MRVYLSLGSNLGDRVKNIRAAISALNAVQQIHVCNVSGFYETAPIGIKEQSAFINAAIEVETDLGPHELLEKVKTIEADLGRTPTVRWGPRVIDIDLILFGDMMLESDCLILPHKEFRNRAFVLVPLAEIAPDVVDPVTGLTVRELAARPEAAGQVQRQDTGDR